MKAALIHSFGPPDVFQVTETAKPIIEKLDDILIKVIASSINPVDWKIRKGNLKFILGSKFPIILGFDAAGEVVETGSSVTRFKKGDLVYARLDKKFGRAYAEYATGSESAFALKPENISFEEAAAIPLAALTALQGLRDKGAIKKGQKVLINGAASGVGHFAVQLVKHFGAECTAVSSFRHIELIERLKPDHFIDYTKEDFKSGKEKYDLIFDIVGMETFLTCKHCLNPGGIYVTTLPRPKVIFHKIVSLFSNGKKAKTLLMKPLGIDLDYLLPLILHNQFFVKLDKVFPLEEITAAHTYSETGRAEGKIVVQVG